MPAHFPDRQANHVRRVCFASITSQSIDRFAFLPFPSNRQRDARARTFIISSHVHAHTSTYTHSRMAGAAAPAGRRRLLGLLLFVCCCGMVPAALGFFHPPPPPAGSKLISISPHAAKPSLTPLSLLPPLPFVQQPLEGRQGAALGPLFSDFTPVRAYCVPVGAIGCLSRQVKPSINSPSPL